MTMARNVEPCQQYFWSALQRPPEVTTSFIYYFLKVLSLVHHAVWGENTRVQACLLHHVTLLILSGKLPLLIFLSGFLEANKQLQCIFSEFLCLLEMFLQGSHNTHLCVVCALPVLSSLAENQVLLVLSLLQT